MLNLICLIVYWCGGENLIFHKGSNLVKGYLDMWTMKSEQSFYGSQNSENYFPFLLSMGMVLFKYNSSLRFIGE